MNIIARRSPSFVKVSSCLRMAASLGTEATTPSALVPVFSKVPAGYFEFGYCVECGGDEQDHLMVGTEVMCLWEPITEGYCYSRGEVIAA